MGTTQDPQIWSHRGRFDAFFFSNYWGGKKNEDHARKEVTSLFLCRWHEKTIENNWMNIAHYKESKNTIQRWRWLKMVALFSITSDVFASLSYITWFLYLGWYETCLKIVTETTPKLNWCRITQKIHSFETKNCWLYVDQLIYPWYPKKRYLLVLLDFNEGIFGVQISFWLVLCVKTKKLPFSTWATGVVSPLRMVIERPRMHECPQKPPLRQQNAEFIAQLRCKALGDFYDQFKALIVRANLPGDVQEPV